MNLILCGMMGAGKSTVGKKIADLTGRVWCDTDEWIVANHGNIADIFKTYGEAYFRRLERETVDVLAKKDGLIISTGGGLVLARENCVRLQENGKIVFLRAQLKTLEERLTADNSRPLLQAETGTLVERLTSLLNARAPIYEQVSDYIVDVDGKSLEEIANEIILQLPIGEKI